MNDITIILLIAVLSLFFGICLVFFNKKTVDLLLSIDFFISTKIPLTITFMNMMFYGKENTKKMMDNGDGIYIFKYIMGFAYGIGLLLLAIFIFCYELINHKF
jgi:hypothetical protein